MSSVLKLSVFLMMAITNTCIIGQVQVALNLRIEYPEVGMNNGKIVPHLIGNYPNDVEYVIQFFTDTYVVTDSLVDIPHPGGSPMSVHVVAREIVSGDSIAFAEVSPGFAGDVVSVEFDSFLGPINEFICDGFVNGQVNTSYSLDSISVSGSENYSEYWDSAINYGSLADLNLSNLCSGFFAFHIWLSLPQVITTSVYIETVTTDSSSIDVEVFSTPSLFDFCTGEAMATLTGGTPPFQYYWDLIPGTNLATDLCVGMHSLKVIDAAGDSTMTIFGIPETGSLYDYSDTTLSVVDTIYFMTEDCGIDYSAPIDSIAITYIEFMDDSLITLGFSIWQGTEIFYVQDTASYNPGTDGFLLIDLTQFCLNKAFGGQIVKFRDNINYFLTFSDQSSDVFNIYPNPTSDYLKISLENFSTITILDMKGEIILSTNNSLIDISHLPSGIYLINVFNLKRELISTQKFVVK